MRRDGEQPIFNRNTFPFRPEIYVVFHDFQEIWIKGSFALAMGKAKIEEKHCAGYKLCLANRETIDKLKSDPNYIYEIKEQIKEREDAEKE